MTVINKVNDDSERYFSSEASFCFVNQCYNLFFINLLIYMLNFYFLIFGALFFGFMCAQKVPLFLQIETSIRQYETS